MVKDLHRNKELGAGLNDWRGELAYERENIGGDDTEFLA